MKPPQPVFEPPKHLEEVADAAELRKRRAIDALTEKLGGRLGDGGRFERAMVELIEADERALQERGR